jgi:hypothetical protein
MAVTSERVLPSPVFLTMAGSLLLGTGQWHNFTASTLLLVALFILRRHNGSTRHYSTTMFAGPLFNTNCYSWFYRHFTSGWTCRVGDTLSGLGL